MIKRKLFSLYLEKPYPAYEVDVVWKEKPALPKMKRGVGLLGAFQRCSFIEVRKP